MKLRILGVMALILAVPGAGRAGTVSTNFNVTATVLNNCIVSASDLAFGSYSASLATPTTANTTVNVTCTSGLAYTVALDGGTNTHSVAARAMTDGSSHNLTYGLYTSAAFSSLWGDGTSSTVTASGTGSGSTQSLTVYGRIDAAQFIPAGSYSDRIAVTVSY